MGKAVFDVELLHAEDTNNHPCVSLALPATPWELADALDALRLGDGGMIVDVLDYHGYDFLDDHLAHRENIYALNELAKRLSEWNDVQRETFRGMVSLEKLGEDHCLPTLINIAYSENSYNVAFGAVDDEKLGRFYVDGGFVPETDDLTDAQCELLDYAKIGRNMREGENGTFTDIGYIVKTGEIEEIYGLLDLKPGKPDYAVLLKLTAADCGQTTMLKLPTSQADLDAALRQLGRDNWHDVSYTCEDCKVPALRDAISATSAISVVDRAARTLAQFTDEKLIQYKTLLAARGFDGLADALDAADTLDEYVFSPEFASFEDIGRGEINLTMSGDTAELIMPYVNLCGFGKAVAEHDRLILTEYGGIERRDSQPIQTQRSSEQSIGGMILE